ncbi:MAG: branched-chain amino acid ABC transporter substrate-binding protein [Anaerolineae bacterium]
MTSCTLGICSGTRPILKIGLAAPFEGVGRPLGYETLQGVRLAISQWNARGGPGGHMVELVALNDSNNAQEARLQAKEFVADPAVLGVIAGWSAETAGAMVPILSQKGLATVLPWSVSPALADLDHGIVMIAAHEGQIAKALVEHLPATVPRCHVAIVGDEQAVAPYLDHLPSCARKVAPPAVLRHHALQMWTTSLLQERTSSPEVLILVVDPISGGEIVKVAKETGWSGSLFGAVDMGSTQLLDVAGESAEGIIIASPAPSGEDLSFRPSQELTSLTFLTPRAVLAYDATFVLLTAIEKSIAQEGFPSRKGTIAALPKVQIDGLTGIIAFDANGWRLRPSVWLYRIEDNRCPGVLIKQVEM